RLIAMPACPAPMTTTSVRIGCSPVRDTVAQATVTVTLVGFVMMSNTAERFWDCATSASICSRVASASMSKVTLTSSNPLRTSLSAPRMPRMSIAPSSVAVTECSWMLRICATAATPAVRQPASPDSTSSTGVAPLSSDAKTSGWSMSNVNSLLWLCSWPRPKKPLTLDRLWVPPSHRELARQVNRAACGACFSASRAPTSAVTLTPFPTGFSATVLIWISSDGGAATRGPPAAGRLVAPCIRLFSASLDWCFHCFRPMRTHYLQHVPFEGLGSVAPWLRARGFPVTATRFYEDPTLPDPAAIDLLLVMGGPMSVNDEDPLPWLVAEKRFVRAVIT